MRPILARRLGEIGEAVNAKAVIPINADAWEIEGDTSGHTLGEKLRADRRGLLDEQGRIAGCAHCFPEAGDP